MKKGPFKKYWLVQRRLRTLDAYLSGNFGGRFYQDDFLNGVASQIAVINKKTNRNGSICLMLTSLLAFLGLVQGSIEIAGLKIQLSSDLMPVITFLVASSFMSFVLALIDQFLIGQYLSKIGSFAGIYSFDIVLLDKIANNLWSEVLTPDFFGEKSGVGQKVILYFFVFLVFLMLFGLLAYPVIIAGNVILSQLFEEETKLVAKFLFSFATLIFSTVLLIIFTFCIRFKYYPADFNEVDNTPTEEFLSKIEKQLSEEK
ncbi:hypothetical protein [Lentilitoribacter sp. Alg239-R112]|uniref:hypothetical protein n=1 Tax=Lentilitoribacter sp. Alg239-R112 TaxID=2305987 RepID=UPI0013A6FE4D|nr:hypothetical protein [Lentilitoribacter sp. Alg239-R112]